MTRPWLIFAAILFLAIMFGVVKPAANLAYDSFGWIGPAVMIAAFLLISMLIDRSDRRRRVQQQGQQEFPSDRQY